MLNRNALFHVLGFIENREFSAGTSWNQRQWNTADFIIGSGRRLLRMALGRPMKDDKGEEITCGTAACFAGWTVILHAPEGTKLRAEHVELPSGRHTYVDDYARQLLGLSHEQGEELFAYFNTVENLRDMIERYCDEEDRRYGTQR